jgi:hypothetical protein
MASSRFAKIIVTGVWWACSVRSTTVWVEIEYEERTDGCDAYARFTDVEIHVKRDAGKPLVEADRLFEPVMCGKHPREDSRFVEV